jgi:DNA polymerase III subunit beta
VELLDSTHEGRAHVKLRAERTEFVDAITWATRTVSNRSHLPALAGIQLEAADGRLTCRATDLETSVEVVVPVQVEEPGAVLLPGRLLAQIAPRLPDHPVELDGTAETVTITCGRATFDVRGMAADDFPRIPEPEEDAPSGAVKAEQFVRMANQVSRAASTDEVPPVLAGVSLEAGAEELTAAATDRFRLAVRTLRWDRGTEASAIVPARALTEAARAATEAGGEVSIVFEEGQTSFVFPDRRLTTNHIEGTFPNWRGLIPEAHETRVVADRGALVEALQRVAVVAVARANTPVSLAFEDGTIELTADNKEEGSAVEALPAEVEGEGLTIAFNPSYLLSGLEAIGTEQVVIDLRDGLKPAVAHPQGEHADDFVYLLMPVRTD